MKSRKGVKDANMDVLEIAIDLFNKCLSAVLISVILFLLIMSLIGIVKGRKTVTDKDLN